MSPSWRSWKSFLSTSSHGEEEGEGPATAPSRPGFGLCQVCLTSDPDPDPDPILCVPGGYGPPPAGRGAPPPPPPFTSYIVSTPPGGFPPPQGFPQGYGAPPQFSKSWMGPSGRTASLPACATAGSGPRAQIQSGVMSAFCLDMK